MHLPPDTTPSPFKARVVCMAVLLLTALAAATWAWLPRGLAHFLAQNPDAAAHLVGEGTVPALRVAFQAIGIVGGLCALSGLAALIFAHRATYLLLRLTLFAVVAVLAAYIYLTWHGLFALFRNDIDFNGQEHDRATVLKFWWSIAWPALAIALYTGWLHVMLRSRPVFAHFTRRTGDAMAGDHMLESIRTHGHDPRHRRSLYASTITHLTILVLIPWILGLGGCVEAYKVPKGSGNPVVAMVTMVQPKKKEKKTITVRPDSAIIFDIPDLDETEVDQVLQEQTRQTYESNPNALAGNIGAGGGTEGGWPEGMDDYRIRFIHLEHSGAGWDDGMGENSGTLNFLRHFAQVTGFRNIATGGESHSIRLLEKYPDDGFPPFVFLTGNAAIGRLSSDDIRILREYCLKGGMIFANAGSPAFHQSFTHLMRQVFPDRALTDVPDDDMIYQQPFRYPNGAPAFWAHGGTRALGVRHEGRLCVYYHPGDMNDAWRDPKFIDVSPELRQTALNLGVNIVYYAFTHWNDAIAKQKK